jgi:hypothetical protein
MISRELQKITNAGFRIYRLDLDNRRVYYWNGFNWVIYQQYTTKSAAMKIYNALTDSSNCIGYLRPNADYKKLQDAGFSLFRRREEQFEIWEYSNVGSWRLFKRFENEPRFLLEWQDLMNVSTNITDEQ